MNVLANAIAYNFQCDNPTLAARIASIRTDDIAALFKNCFGATVNIMQKFAKPPKCEAAKYIVDNAPPSLLAGNIEQHMTGWESAANRQGGRPVNKYRHDPSHDNNAWKIKVTPVIKPEELDEFDYATPVDDVPQDVKDIVNDNVPAPVTPSPKPTAKDIHMDTNMSPEEKLNMLAEIFGGNKSAPIDEEAVRIIARDEASKIAPRKVHIHLHHDKDGEPVVIEGYRHPMFNKILRLAKAGLNVMMVGPAGSGKTQLAAHVADALSLDFGAISMTAGASESNLLGRYLPTGNGGKFEYTLTPFMRCYEGIENADGSRRGGLFLIDEFDAGDGNMLIVTNSATSNGYFFNDYRVGCEKVIKHSDSVVMAACNTFGKGADIVYNSRNELDAATLDRFYIVHVDYDTNIDWMASGMPNPNPAADWVANDKPVTMQQKEEMINWCLSIRALIAARNVRRVFSPRASMKAIAAMEAGIPMKEVKADLLAGWSRDELNKVGA